MILPVCPYPSRFLFYIKMKIHTCFLSAVVAALVGSCAGLADHANHRSTTPTCTVKPGGSPSIDDAPAIIAAFKQCGENGNVVFLNETYHINTVMNTTGLKNCFVNLQGTLLVRYVSTR